MDDLPASVAQRLQALIYGERAGAWLQIDGALVLLAAGGHLDRYGLTALRPGEPVVPQALFLEGLLPLAETPFFHAPIFGRSNRRWLLEYFQIPWNQKAL